MDVLKFNFEVRFKGSLLNASCHKFQVHNYPQYRVVVASKQYKVPVMVFYETAPAKFFWFRQPERNQVWEKAIAEGLKTFILKNPATKLKGIK